MKQRIYTDGFNFMTNFIEVEATDITVNQVLGSKDEITMKVESETAIAFNLGYCYAPTHSTTGVYLLNELPTYEKKSEFKHIYNLTFQGLMHDLSKIAFTGPNNECEFFYNGRAIDFVTLIVARMAAAKAASDIVSTWYVGNTESRGLTDTTGFKNIQFSNQNCWQALNSVCDEFEFEFEIGRMSLAINTIAYLSIKKLVGHSTGKTIAYGKSEIGQSGGVYNIKRTNVNVDKLITRLFYFGSDQNLPSGYTEGTRLKGTSIYKSLNENIYGRRDGFQTFEEIKPSFTGAVTSFEINADKENVITAPFPFDLSAVDAVGNTLYLIGGTAAKVVFLTGDCAGYTFDILDKGFDWDGTNATIKLIKYIDEGGNSWPNTTVKPNTGDLFTIVDIRMPEVYLNDAVTSLDLAAQDYLVKYSTPRVQYTIETDPKYCYQNDISFKIGDKMTIDDSDLNISETCRVIETSYKLYDRYKATIKLSDVRFAIPTRKIKSQLKQLDVVAKATKANSVTKILKSQKTTNELKSSVFSDDNKFNTERVRNESLDPVGLALDSGELQYSMKETRLKSTEAGIEYTDGIVTHHSMNGKTRAEIKKLQKKGIAYAPSRTWNLAAGSSSVPTDKSAYIYLDLPLGENESVASIVTSETHLWAKQTDNHILYKLGTVGSLVNGKRSLNILWGGDTTGFALSSEIIDKFINLSDTPDSYNAMHQWGLIVDPEIDEVAFSHAFGANVNSAWLSKCCDDDATGHYPQQIGWRTTAFESVSGYELRFFRTHDSVMIGKNAGSNMNLRAASDVAFTPNGFMNIIDGTGNTGLGNGAGNGIIHSNNNILIGNLADIIDDTKDGYLNIGNIIRGYATDIELSGNFTYLKGQTGEMRFPEGYGDLNRFLQVSGVHQMAWSAFQMPTTRPSSYSFPLIDENGAATWLPLSSLSVVDRFTELVDTFSSYPTGGLGYMLISGDSSVLYSQAFGSDSEGAWAQITPELENVGSNILANTYFSPSTGWTIGSPWIIQSFPNSPPYDYGAYFDATGSGIISQQITLESGKTYRVELFASDYGTTPLVEVLINGVVVATATEGDSSRYLADFESTTTGTATLGIKATSPGTLAVFTVTVSEVTITAGRGLRMCNSGHATQYILPTSAPSEGDVVFARADGQLIFKPLSESLTGVVLDSDFPTAGLMLTDGAGNYSVVDDNSATWNTALVDADFASNGLMVRTGAGVYSTVADNSATWNTLASLGTKTFWNGTQAAYNAIATKDSNTIYFINV